MMASQPISVDEARTRVIALAQARRLGSEHVALDRAGGRVLAEDLVAGHDLPPFANSAMDGFALASSDLPRGGEGSLRIIGTRLAGDPGPARLSAGECLRITTGAPLPQGADTVVIKERVRVDGDRLVIGGDEVAHANVRPAGEDFRRDEVALCAGTRITPACLAVLASLGQARVQVARRPRVAILTTGNELVMPGEPLGDAQIHNSNGFGFAALVASSGACNRDVSPPFRHVRDDPSALREALLAAASEVDVIISSGGVSAGEADFLPAILADIGQVNFWKVSMRPGMPVLSATIGNTLVFSLPGNPVSGMATYLNFVEPALAVLQGASTYLPRIHYARLAAPLAKRHDRTEFLRATTESRDDGSLWVTPLAKQGSGMLRGMVEADALLIVPRDVRELSTGEVVETMPIRGYGTSA